MPAEFLICLLWVSSAFGEIAGAAASAVSGVAIVAEHGKLRNFTLRNAHDDWHDIIRNTIRVFADKPRWVVADRIKVAQESGRNIA